MKGNKTTPTLKQLNLFSSPNPLQQERAFCFIRIYAVTQF